MKNLKRMLQTSAFPGFRCARLRVGGPLAYGLILSLSPYLPASIALAQTSVIKASSVSNEERVKAAFLHKFLNYAEWPAASLPKSDSPYVIGIDGADDIADELAKLAAGRTVNDRQVLVKKLQPGDALDGIHVLFIGKAARIRQAQLLKLAHLLPILLITESEGALAQGSMINFRLVEDRVRFEVALDPVEKSGLRLNSRMLTVAIAVSKGAPQ